MTLSVKKKQVKIKSSKALILRETGERLKDWQSKKWVCLTAPPSVGKKRAVKEVGGRREANVSKCVRRCSGGEFLK